MPPLEHPFNLVEFNVGDLNDLKFEDAIPASTSTPPPVSIQCVLLAIFYDEAFTDINETSKRLVVRERIPHVDLSVAFLLTHSPFKICVR
jgi:hypothetical protein